MDTSKQYIKMCEKAQEIQESHTFDEEEGDFSIWLPRQDQLQGMIEGTVMEKIEKFNKFMHLPILNIKCNEIDEEKLEIFREKWGEMMKDSLARITPLPVCENEELNLINVFTSTFTSFEQLWLAFVMKEKYGKTWNNKKEEWKNEN